MSRDLALLHPKLRPLCEKHLALCKAVGIDLHVTQTWRSREEQDELYAQGRTKPGRIVTNARGGQSDHEYIMAISADDETDTFPASLAYDVCFVTERSPSGGVMSIDYDGPWETVGWIAIQQCGLKWGGLWTKPDRPHFYIGKNEA